MPDILNIFLTSLLHNSLKQYKKSSMMSARASKMSALEIYNGSYS